MANQNFRVKNGLEVGVGGTILYAEDTGRIGIDTTAPQTTLDCNGSFRLISGTPVSPSSGVGLELYYVSDTFTGAPTAFIQSYDRDASLYKPITYAGSEHRIFVGNTEKVRIDSLGRLGVGTPSPGNTLHLAGSNGVGVRIENTSNSISAYSTLESTGALQANVSGAGFFNWVTGGGEKVRIDNSGRLKVGTTTDIIWNQTSVDGVVIEQSGATQIVRNGDVPLLVTRNTSTGQIVKFSQAGTERGGILYDGDFGISSAADLTFDTSGIERVRLDSSGRLGIGTDNPIRKVDIRASAVTAARLQVSSGGYNWIELASDDNSGNLSVSVNDRSGGDGAGSFGINQYDGSGSYARTPIVVSSTGDVGIGSDDPYARLDVFTTNYPAAKFNSSYTISSKEYTSILLGSPNTNQGFTLGQIYDTVTPSAGYLHITPYGLGEGENFSIKHNGNVGIGITNPSQKLDVNGAARFRGAIYDNNNVVGAANSVLSSTGSGVQWVSVSAGSDADTLDGLDSSQFLRSDANDSASGVIDFLGGSSTVPAVRVKSGGNSWSEGLAVHPSADNGYALAFFRPSATLTTTTNTWALGNLGVNGTNDFGLLRSGLTGSAGIRADSIFDVTQAGVFRFGFNPTVGSNAIWHAGNDGSGSGLDADLLDGIQGGSFLRSDTADSIGGKLTGGVSAGSDVVDFATNDNYASMRVIRNNVSSGGNSDGMYIGYVNGNNGNTRIYGGGANSGGILVQGSGVNDVKIAGSTAWHQGNDGSGSGLDADYLDGLDSTQFLRSDATDTATGAITFTNSGLQLSGHWYNGFYSGTQNYIHLFPGGHSGSASATDIRAWNGSGNDVFRILGGSATGLTWRGNTIWTAENDGSGSGLDADTLDGINSGSFLRSDADDTFTGVLDSVGNASGYRFDGRSFSWNSSMQTPTTYVPHVMQDTWSGWDPVLGVKTSNGFWQFGAYTSDTLHLGYMAGAFGSHSTNGFDNSLTISPSSMAFNGNTIWHGGNDGAGSGLDADNLDGYTWASSGKQVRASDFYADDWFRNYNSGEGLYNEANASHFYSAGSSYWHINSNNTSAAALVFYSEYNSAQGGGTGRKGYVYWDASGFGLLSNDGTWAYRHDNTYADIFGTIRQDGSNTVWHAGNDGSGSGLDADTVDGLDSSQFLRSDANDEGTGSYLFNRNNPTITNSSYGQGSNNIELRTTDASNPIIGFHRAGYSATALYHLGYGINSLRIRNADGNDGPIFSTFNDGSGSGLDADLLDGLDSSQFLRSDADDNTTGKLLIGGNYGNNSYNSVSSTRLLFGGGSAPDNYFIGTNLENYGGNFTKLDFRWHTGIRMGAQQGYGGTRIFGDENLSTLLFSVGKGDTNTRVESGSLLIGGNTAWHAGNDGSGSGLDADSLDGYTWASGGKNVRATDFYADDWFRNYNSGEGLYNEATTQHFYSDDDNGWNIAGGTDANWLRFRDEHGGTTRGYVYANNSSEIGFLNSSGSWSLRCDNSGNATATGSVTATQITASSDLNVGGELNFSYNNNKFIDFYADSGQAAHLRLVNGNSFHVMMRMYRDGAAELMHAGNTKLSTTSTGVSVTGDLSNTGTVTFPYVWSDTSVAGANMVVTINGNIRRSTSSIKYKTNVETLEDSYADAILNCRPVWYQSICPGDNPDYGHWGFIAEEVAEIDPRLCSFREQEDGTLDPEGVQYDRFVPHLLNLIKRQGESIKEQNNKINDLQEKIEKLMSQ